MSFARPCHLSLTCLNFSIRPCSSCLTLPLSCRTRFWLALASQCYWRPGPADINVASTASVVPAPTASQFNRELEDILVAEGTSWHERRAEHHSEVSHLRHNIRNTGLGYRSGSGVA